MIKSSPKYTGALLPNGLRHGQGTLQYTNTFFKYSGQWLKGEKQGSGQLLLGDGGSVEGHFESGEIEGHGKRVWNDGSFYIGSFHLGEKHGEGTQQYCDGSKYQGSWEDNRMHGNGELVFSNGDSYIGEFVNHKRHGTGILQCANGDSFDGFWDHDVQTGYGVSAWSNGDIYEGEWENGKRHGLGRFVDGVTGIQYSGKWADDSPEIIPQKIVLNNCFEDTCIDIEALPGQNLNEIFKHIAIVGQRKETVIDENNSENTYSIVTEENGRSLIVEIMGEENRIITCLNTNEGIGYFNPEVVLPEEYVVGLSLTFKISDAELSLEEQLVPVAGNLKIVGEVGNPNKKK